MTIALRNLITRAPRFAAAVGAVALLAVVTLAAQQFETFAPEFEGELWEMVGTVTPPHDGSWVNGVVFTEADGKLFVSDGGAATIEVYDAARQLVNLPDADWALGQSENAASPVYGWVPNQLTTARLQLAGETAEQTVILVSDIADGAHRMFAFDTTGHHLFTVDLNITGLPAAPEDALLPVGVNPPSGGFVNGLAMGRSAKFILTPGAKVELVGSFAAAFARSDRKVGATLAFHNQEFLQVGDGVFAAVPAKMLTGAETVVGLPAAVQAKEPFGLTFDSVGNLYVTDSVTERLTVYGPGPLFTRQFTFGTPDPEDNGETTVEFFQSYGIRFWPDPTGTDGRIFVADAINNRVLAYRPNFSTKTLDSIFALDGIGKLDGFPYGLAIDPSSGRIAIGDDFGARVEDENGDPILGPDGFEQFLPRAWILKTPDLAAFNVQVFDANGAPVQALCVGAEYTVKFSLTVPAGRNPVSDVAPQLNIDGTPTAVVPTPGDPLGYPATPLLAGQSMTFSYALTAPLAATSVKLEAGVDLASLGSIHVLTRQIKLPVSTCQPAAIAITASPSVLPQLSGWTAVRPGQTFKVTLVATDTAGVRQIDYQVDGANRTITHEPVVNSDPALVKQEFDVWLPQMGMLPQLGETTVSYSALNRDYVMSAQHTLVLNLVAVPDRANVEGEAVGPLLIGPPAPTSGVTYSAQGLPDGLTIDQVTGHISGTLTYGAAGAHTVTVTESRGSEQPTSVTFLWTVNDQNRPPTVAADSYTIDEDTVLSPLAAAGVLANDSDPDGALVVGWSDTPSHGTLSLNSDGSFTYTPAGNFSGTDSFRYRANDGVVDSDLVTVSITVNAVNDPPAASNATAAVDEDGTLTGTLPAAVDPDSTTLTYAKAGDPAHGTVTVNPGGSYQYQPAPGYNGSDAFTYKANDGAADSAPATVTITVNSVNDPPASGDDAASVSEGGLVVIDVLANDADADGALDPSSVTIVTGPAHGQVMVSLAGTVTYTHNASETTSDSFTYRVRDASEFGAPATVVITVTPVNDAPVVSNTAATVTEDEVLSGTLPAATDSDSTTLTYAKASEPAHGTVTVNPDGSYTYTPARNYNGPDLFSYTANDGALTSAPATVTISVAPVADPPTALDGVASVDEDGVLSSTLPVGQDPDGSILAYLLLAGPSHGSVTIDFATGAFVYRPAPDFAGSDSFTYEVNDHLFESAPATITITVNPVNDAPVAAGGSATVAEDVALNGTLVATDVDSANLTYVLVSGAAHGTVTVAPNGSYTYTPAANYNGGDSFTFKSNDGELDSNVSTVTIAVTPVGDAPVAAAGSAAVDEDAVLLATLPVAVDADSTDLTYAKAGNPAHGTVFVALDGSYVYTPNANFNGTDSFTYTASDGGLTSAPATITIAVRPVNDAPVAVADLVTAQEDVAATYSDSQLVANDTDLDGDQLTIAAVTSGTGGTAVLNANGTVTFTPAPGFSGVAAFTYRAFDGTVASNTVTVTVNVAVVNDAPVAVADTLTATEDTQATYPAAALTGNDTDAENAALTIASVTSGVGGTVTFIDGTITFTPAANFSGAATFTYTVTDGELTSAPVTVTLNVAPVNDAPVATADTVDATEDIVATYPASRFLGNDTDADGDTLTIGAVTSGLGGTVSLDGGSVVFTPTPGFSGAATFSYTVTDGTLTSMATVTVNVAAVNDAPVAVADTLTATEDVVSTYPAAALTANDTDPEGTALTVLSVASGVGGTVTFSAGTVTFTPAPNFSGAATFTYTVSDGALTSSATVTVNVAPVNDPPVAANDAFSVGQGQALTVPAPGVLAGDTDVDNAVLTANLVAGPSHGTLALNLNGSFVYTPAANYYGSDSFTYRANDGQASSGLATVTITVVPSNRPPVCTAVASPSILWPPNHKPVYLTLSGITDPDGGTPTIRFTSILQDEPTNSTGQGNTMQDGGIEADGTQAWVRPERTGGGDGRVYLINYIASDADGASCTGQVTLSVPHDQSGAPAVLSPGRWNSLTGRLEMAPPLPVAVNDTATVAKSARTAIAVLANDVANGSPLTVTIEGKPAMGTATVNADGTVTYKASKSTGTVTFTYRITDIYGSTATATVTIIVTS